MPSRCRLAFVSLVFVLLASAHGVGGEIDFTRDIRPILSNACFQCHGPDAESREADLRLDTKENAFASVEGRAPFAQGKLAESEAWLRIISDDPDERMPPADSGKSLTAEQTALIRKWIEEGAQWSGHWAFTAPQRPNLPVVKQKHWVRRPFDAFVLHRLEMEGLRPSAEAAKLTLLRRLSLDLIGLPPTIEEVDAFLADTKENAYQRQVERLLQSPHYGERWGRLWLDNARYADSDGYEKDKPRSVWFYRDWVINAMNRDLPYDQFIIEQLAGDMLPNATQEQMVATGFLRNSMVNEEGGVDPEQFRMEAMYDRMDAIGKSILGLTIQCAQCHNHKYDPFTQKNYYQIFAFLNNAHEANIAVYTPPEQQQRRRIFSEIDRIENEIKQQTPDWRKQMADWETSVRGNQPQWTVVAARFVDKTLSGQKFLPLDDGSYLAQGYAPTKTRPQLVVHTDMRNIGAFRLELLTDPNLPLGGPGRSIYGTGALSEFEVEAAPAETPGKMQRIKIARATSDLNAPRRPLDAVYNDKSDKQRVVGPIDYAIDGDVLTAWSSDAGPHRRNRPRKAVFVPEKPISHSQGTVLNIYLNQRHGGWNSDNNQNYNLGRFRISITPASNATADALPRSIRALIETQQKNRTAAQEDAIFSYWRTTVDAWKNANEQIDALWREHPEGASQLVLRERTTLRATHLLSRGDFLKPLQQVASGVPTFLHSLPAGKKPNRLAFARWLADRRSPTTARTIVNRIWQAYFGVGIVATSEDLGSQGEARSHPELLDWLAVDFMDQGWSLKGLHRRIVTSATYRQSSQLSPKLAQQDPYNRKLARSSRIRVDAEIVRDIALAASGLLNPHVGGPSVYPPAPAFLFKPPASYGPKTWLKEQGKNRYRRGLYTFRYRSVPYPALEAFDAPNGDASCIRRSRSNTPLQALTTLNEPLFVECAQALALRTLRAGGDSAESKMAYAFRRCLARKPTMQEAATLHALLERQTKKFSAAGAQPWDFAAADPDHPPALPNGATPARLAAWTVVARVLLNLDETITRE